MSDIDIRQAYVFLKKGDHKQARDEYFAEFSLQWKEVPESMVSQMVTQSEEGWYRRPISQPQQQADKLTVWDEYAKAALIGLLANNNDNIMFSNVVSTATEYADEMMKARAK